MKYDLWKTERERAEVVEPFGVRVLRQPAGTGVTVKLWRPKATKPDAFVRFSTEERREDYVARYLEGFARGEAMKAERKAEAKAVRDAAEPVKKGTLFVHSWGYDQTNVDFYQVVRVTASGKTVTVKAVGSEEVPGSQGFMCATVKPVKNAFLTGTFARELRKTVQYTSDGRPYLSFEYGWCGLYEKPLYSSWYA